MLDIVRNLVSSIFGKILLGIMVLSFALWGVGDILSSGNSQLAAKIGKEKITLDEFYYEFQSLVQNYNQSTNSNLSIKEAYEMNLHNVLLNELVYSNMINDYAKNKKMLLNNQSLKKIVMDLPQFQKKDGSFSVNIYKNYILNNFESEDVFLKEIEKTIYQGLIFEIFDVKNFINKSTVDLFYKYEGERRKIEFFIINKNKIQIENNQNLIKKYFNENKNNYLTNPTVIIDYVAISLDDFKDSSKIGDEQIINYYNSNLELYSKNEIRKVQVMRFNEKNNSEDFYNNAKNLDESDFGNYLLKNNININTIDDFNGETFTDEIAKLVFNLELNELSETIEYSEIGFFNFRVTKITPAEIKKFDSVRGEILEYLTLEDAFVEYDNAINYADEMLLNDFDIFEISENISNAKIFDSVDSSEFNKIIGEELNYNNPVGYVSDIKIIDNSAFVYKIKNKNDPFIPDFEDISDKVILDYTEMERNRIARIKVDELLNEFQFQPAKLLEEPAVSNLYEQTLVEIERSDDKFSDDTLKEIFNSNKNVLLKLQLRNGNIGIGHIVEIFEVDDFISDNLYASIKNNVNLSFNKSIESLIGNEIIKNSNYEIYYNNIDKLFM